ncbi:MAG: M23 family metallopeptidase [Candidatus Methanoperedenaceae archaeon]|nr:M23 family metallopeptidase [Candidatus Methanoperedenaceae archaeon]MDW7727327.1 M23 family metallopeptidase [Candidatus Methanoperedens sp.]
MKKWPVPNSYCNPISSSGSPGSFWENRIDRYHCGVDIYALPGSDVISIESGCVVRTEEFTSPSKVPYWNVTYNVLVETKRGLLCRYAELRDVAVNTGDRVKAGQLIGHVGLVLDTAKITETSPHYIRKIKENGSPSMLHFELWDTRVVDSDCYLGGNWFGSEKPQNLLDPTEYLESTLETGSF